MVRLFSTRGRHDPRRCDRHFALIRIVRLGLTPLLLVRELETVLMERDI